MNCYEVIIIDRIKAERVAEEMFFETAEGMRRVFDAKVAHVVECDGNPHYKNPFAVKGLIEEFGLGSDYEKDWLDIVEPTLLGHFAKLVAEIADAAQKPRLYKVNTESLPFSTLKTLADNIFIDIDEEIVDPIAKALGLGIVMKWGLPG